MVLCFLVIVSYFVFFNKDLKVILTCCLGNYFVLTICFAVLGTVII